jgi:hypothetical protein
MGEIEIEEKERERERNSLPLAHLHCFSLTEPTKKATGKDVRKYMSLEYRAVQEEGSKWI